MKSRYKKPNWSPEVILMAEEMTAGYCIVPGCRYMADDLHHGLHNTKYNNGLYPLYTQSILNAYPLCRIHHSKHPFYMQPDEPRVKVYEKYLQELKEGGKND